MLPILIEQKVRLRLVLGSRRDKYVGKASEYKIRFYTKRLPEVKVYKSILKVMQSKLKV